MLQLIIPAYNEEARLPRTLCELRRHVLGNPWLAGAIEVIVVDNASTDRTAEVAREADTAAVPVRVVHCATPGKGAAVAAGIALTDSSLVGFMDADGATGLAALEEASRLIGLGADLALASRAAAGSHTEVRSSWVREVGARRYRALTERIVPGIGDTQCGFKIMRGDLGRRLFGSLTTDGFSFDVELLARAQAHGAVLAEFPVAWADVPGSTFQPLLHGAGSFVDLARISRRLRAERTLASNVGTVRTPRRRQPRLAPLAVRLAAVAAVVAVSGLGDA